MSESNRRQTQRLRTIVCSDEFGVTSVSSSGGRAHVARREPCEECPWRKDVPTGVFPPTAFTTSAHTAYDAATSTFGCHMSGVDSPATCAGFLLRHSDNNLSVRLGLFSGRLELSRLQDGGVPLYDSYRDMAVANGVDPDDPSLQLVRANGEEAPRPDRARRTSSTSQD